jgi:hypothetical protein
VRLAPLVLAALVVAPAWGLNAKSPSQLVLARSDLPAGAKPIAKQTGAVPALSWIHDPSAKALFRTSGHYEATYRLPTKDVHSTAFVFWSQAAARTAFAKLAGSLDKHHRRVNMPRLGDAQVTTYVVADGLEHRFIVRRDDVVWQLDIVDWNAVSRVKSRAEAFALARKQQARVG